MGPAGNGTHQDVGASADLYSAPGSSTGVFCFFFFSPVILCFHKICQLARRKALVPPGDLLLSIIPQGIKHFSGRLESRQL